VNRTVSLVATALLLTGCAGGDLLVQRQTSLEGRMEQLAQAQSRTGAQIGDLQRQVQGLQEQLARQTASARETEPERAALRERVATVARRLDRIESDLLVPQASRIEVVNRDPVAPNREERAQSAYMKAFGLFSANDYPAAATAFTAVMTEFPGTEYGDNALFWLGECYYGDGRYQQAIDVFARVLAAPAMGKRAPEALLRTGLSWYGLNEPDKGRGVLRTLVDTYPGSPAAGAAKERLDRQ
jgi:tol-pal system protein YbgF